MGQSENCHRCATLLVQERHLPASYEATIKLLYDFGHRLKPDKYERDRMLADQRWDSLMQAMHELQEHQREHLVRECGAEKI